MITNRNKARPCASKTHALGSIFLRMLRRVIGQLAGLTLVLLLGAPAQAMLPTPLSDPDVAQYIRLFELQQQGNMKQATREMGRLKDPLLKGHLLFLQLKLVQ